MKLFGHTLFLRYFIQLRLGVVNVIMSLLPRPNSNRRVALASNKDEHLSTNKAAVMRRLRGLEEILESKELGSLLSPDILWRTYEM